VDDVAIVIDPGHGGVEAAGRSTPLGVRGPLGTLEKTVTMNLARRLAANLGPTAALTREGDVNLSLAARADRARRASARVFLSLHANRGIGGERGAEAWVHDQASERCHSLAGRMLAALGAVRGAPSGRGIKAGPMAVLTPDRLARDTAACLLELDFLSHPEGERRLVDDDTVDAMAAALAKGVRDHLSGEHRLGDGETPTADTPGRIYTPDDIALPPAWTAADLPGLRASSIYLDSDDDNATVLDQFVRDLPAEPNREFWIALVPGSSEAKGHHKAWVPPANDDPQRPALVEPEFKSRLDHAFRLLDEGVVRYILVSGGAVDESAPDYVEGRRGRAQLISDHADDWTRSPESRGAGDALGSRVIVDPFAIHSVSNIRNCDRLTALLGLDRNLIVTTAGTFSQGWWFTHDPWLGSFDDACTSQLGYTLGQFERISPGPSGGNTFGTGKDDNPNIVAPAFATMVIAHWNLSKDQLLSNDVWT
jgi:N-acetylmuramoyl-L-alanine amidase